MFTKIYQCLLILLTIATLCNCQALISLMKTSYMVIEGEQVKIEIQKTGTAASDINVVVEISDPFGNGRQDFVSTSQATVISAGIDTFIQDVFLTTVDDSIPEKDEVFELRLKVTNGHGALNQPDTGEIIIIASDYGFGVFGFVNPRHTSAEELPNRDNVASLPIERRRGTFGEVILHYQVVSHNGDARKDISPSIGNITFFEGESLQPLKIYIMEDSDPEWEEIFQVILTDITSTDSIHPSAMGPVINVTQQTANITVAANDAPIRFEKSVYHVDEQSYKKNVQIIVTRGITANGVPIGPVNKAASVVYYVVPLTAEIGKDFEMSNGTLLFAPGATHAVLNVEVLTDNVPEEAESFKIVLDEINGDAVIKEPFETTIIINANDDPNGVISFKIDEINQSQVVRMNEDSESVTASFVILRNGGHFGRVSINWELQTVDGVKVSPDVSPPNVSPAEGLVTFLDGETEKTIFLQVAKDDIPEISELYKVQLLADTIQGGGRAEGLLTAELLIEDSDMAYGVVQFTDDNAQAILTDSSPRRLSMTLLRSGGTLGSVNVQFAAKYIDVKNTTQVVFLDRFPSTSTIPVGQSAHTFNIGIRDDAFLRVGSYFTVELLQVEVTGDIKSYNSPVLGPKLTVQVDVTVEIANGEVGLGRLDDIQVTEPDDQTGTNLLSIPVERTGTNGFVSVQWSLTGYGPMADQVTPTDIQPMKGTLTMASGQSQGEIILEVLPDNLPETAETIVLTLEKVEPSNSQRLTPGADRVHIVIQENDNAGGIFEFSPQMSKIYTVQEELDPITVSIIRRGGALVTREVEYYIDSLGSQEEFYGDKNVLVFKPGEVEKTSTLLARKDGVPELNEHFQLKLRSFSDVVAMIGTRNLINITVLENEFPFGVFVFSNNTVIRVDESKPNDTSIALVPVQRTMGRFGTVTVEWSFVDQANAQNDLYPLNGTLQFGPGEGEHFIEVETLVDELPEMRENFTLMLQNTSNGAVLGDNIMAQIVIKKNDEAVFFKEPSKRKMTEGTSLTLIITRDGTANSVVSVKYRTLDGTANVRGGDFQYIEVQKVTFEIGETEKMIDITTLEDLEPETDEVFYVELFDVEGDASIFFSPKAEITIAANDGANGIVSFNPNIMMKYVEEGSSTDIQIVRKHGHYSDVQVYWELLSNNTNRPITQGTEFKETYGNVTLKDLQTTSILQLSAIQDDLPEYDEVFKIVIYNVSGGGPSGQEPVLSNTSLEVYVTILQNDDPFGVFSFTAQSREVSIAEDYDVGKQQSTIAQLEVERKMGSFGEIKVAWEIFSHQIAGGGNLPDFIDLLCVGAAGTGLIQVPELHRPATGTMVYNFTGCPDCYIKVSANHLLDPSIIQKSFSVSGWIQPVLGTTGYIFAKTTEDGSQHYQSLRLLSREFNGKYITRLEFLYSLPDNPNMKLVQSQNLNLQDGVWHHILINIAEGEVHFYLDGQNAGQSTLAAYLIADGPGDLWVGAITPGEQHYTGLMQDIRLFERILDAGEIKELHETPSTKDLKTISGYLIFPEGVTTQQISVESLDDLEEEANDVFAVKLISANKGARVADEDNLAVLTVLKSDNANGLFGFSEPCKPSQGLNENQTFTCEVHRERGDADTVFLAWQILQLQNGLLAKQDFIKSSGMLEFVPGERKKTINFTSNDDTFPELTEHFQVFLASVQSADGLTGTTATSGASIDPKLKSSNISIFDSDYPYGLIQFSKLQQVIVDEGYDLWILPLDAVPQVAVVEEIGVVTLLVERAQGLVGEVAVEWRTVDGTAKSFGKAQPDYVAAVGSLAFNPTEQYKTINITILDNDIPERNKHFEVQLLNPTGGAQVGTGAKIRVNIQYSDFAFGVFQFADDSLKVFTSESNLNTNSVAVLKVTRQGGTIDHVNLTWSMTSDPENDLVTTNGQLVFTDGQTEGEISIVIRDDSLPELDETFIVKIDNVTQGSLGEDKTTAELVIQASDDPYGVFVISEADRPQIIEEADIEAVITIERRRTSGHYGRVRIHYTTVSPLRTLPYLPGSTMRAGMTDFNTTRGSIIMDAGETMKSFNVSIIDDSEPEMDESVYVVLESVELLVGQQERIVPNSPKLGDKMETYGQIIISQNDNPGGVLELSVDKVKVNEDFRGSLVNVVRKLGAFGSVSVKLEVIQGTATYGLDYSVTDTWIYFSNGERQKTVPVSIIDDALPEMEETFTIRLLDDTSGGASLGQITETTVTIESSDDPNGAFGFETRSTIVKEAGLGETVTVDITVVRIGGTLGVVAVEWVAMIQGVLAVDDVSPGYGTIYFVSNEARQVITLNILHDNIPEGDEAVSISIKSANNGGRVMMDRNVFSLIISPNDNPHGVIEFGKPDFIVLEPEQKSLQYIPINRTGGANGQLRVYYNIQELDLLYEATKAGQSVIDYFAIPKAGKPLPVAGTNWNVKSQPNPLQACATFCLLSEVCLSFDYHAERVDCNWFSTGDYDALDDRTGYMFYAKNKLMTTALYSQQAKVDVDFTGVEQQTITINHGVPEGLIPVQIVPDLAPELQEKFLVHLLNVELIGEIPDDPDNIPKIGSRSKAYVTIASNDDANGMFRIYSKDPRAVNNGQIIEVEEKAKLSVELVVERQGGSIGVVSISWRVVEGRTTAAKNSDFTADGATLTFEEGEMQKAITIAIEGDDLPESDEIIVVELYNPGGGAQLGPPQYIQAMVVIMANDYVAGVLGFTKTSYLAKEGDVVTLTVKRTQPALGQLSVSWKIVTVKSEPPAQRFVKHAGNIYFNKGETEKQILLSTIVDNDPKINQEYHVVLSQVITEGIRSTGAAGISEDHGIAVITIEGGNEPHGVFSFSKSPVDRKVQESQGTVQVPLERKFGAIGVVKVFYTIKPGSLRPTGTMVEAASPGLDFMTKSGSILVYDDESSATIPVDVVDDKQPEIDEVFLVELLSVELISPQNSTFLPRIDNSGKTTEVIISANDGTQGEVIFPQEYANITVNEGRRDITLIVRRTKGTFGLVSVFCFAQNAKDGAVRGDDFNFDPRDIKFGPGVSEQIITVQILEDTLPEPDEVFEIVLASPRDGLSVGTPGKAVITIRASDEASGIVNFDSPKNVTLVEPSVNSDINSKATITLIRAPGAFGVVKVPFIIVSPTMEPVIDVAPTRGIFIFDDMQDTATIVIQAEDDNIPEEVEIFTIILNTPEGGASLGTVIRKTVVIDRNDAPYGLLEIFPTGTRDTSIDVEENVGTVYFDILRQSGSLDWVSVDVITTTHTATTQVGQGNFYLGPVQKLKTKGATKWYSFSAHKRIYAILLNPSHKGPLSTGIGTAGGSVITKQQAEMEENSVLYLWQGALTPLKTIETNGASGALSFTVNNNVYLFVTNQGGQTNFESLSRLYRVLADGSIVVVQDLSGKGATSVVHYNHKQSDYLVITNYQNTLGQTNISSSIYKWDQFNYKFISAPAQFLQTKGAMKSHILEIRTDKYLVTANYYDSSKKSYEISSVIYKLDTFGKWNVHQLVPTKGAIDITSFTSGAMVYLVIANTRDNIGDFNQMVVVYVWNNLVESFGVVQEIPMEGVSAVETFLIRRTVFLSIASTSKNSAVHQWNEDRGQFTKIYETFMSVSLHPLYAETLTQETGENYLLGISPDDVDETQELNVYQVDLLGESDYIKRQSSIMFGPGQTSVRVGVYINDDAIPEDTETLYVQLTNPRNGAELGQSSNVTVNILSNDNGHGVVEFAEDSFLRYENELPSGDNDIQLNVVRKQGTNGRVVIRWKITGDHNGIFDLRPVEGLVEFADGQSAATITITVKDDGIAELDETSFVSLIEVVESGSVLNDRGVLIGNSAVAKLIVIANDSPHGVVMWSQLHYMTSEPEGSDSKLTLNIDRTQGSMGDIRISYLTALAASEPVSEKAVSGRDFVAVHGTVEMASGVTQTSVDVTILADDDPEVSESFLVNITDVVLFGPTASNGVTPSVSPPHRLATVTIRENDNARGVVQFDVIRNQENRIDTFEGQGTITLKLSRTVGQFGAIEVTWQTSPREADLEDFSPSGGKVMFEDGQTVAVIEITINDDTVPELLQTFDVKLIRVTSGGATLGSDNIVRIGIMKNDSPNGVFSFLAIQKTVKESTSPTDPEGVVNFDIIRHGTDGEVNVQWRLSAAAVQDFVPPLAGTVHFNAGESRKTITLRTKPDEILEGEERYTLSLISADNNADISPLAGDATVIILADVGASGQVAIGDEDRHVYIGEPSAGYEGIVKIGITRGPGMFGVIEVSWQILPRDAEAFIQTQGKVSVQDKQHNATIIVQARDDSKAELRRTYTLELTAATGGATINSNSKFCDITYAASDYPHGMFEFKQPAEIVVKEESSQVSITVSRNYGNHGEVKVTYTTDAGTATDVDDGNQDFQPISGVLIFGDLEYEKTLKVQIINDQEAEGPEYFFVNLTKVELVTYRNNNYTIVDNVQLDMAPILGPMSAQTIFIDKNDNAEGIVQFTTEAVHFTAYEDKGIAKIPVTRHPGKWGDVDIHFKVDNGTALLGQDFAVNSYVAKLKDGETNTTVDIIIVSDREREFDETFMVRLVRLSGGGVLGSQTTATVTIAKSDYPNGKFSFLEPNQVVIPNPTVERVVSVVIERTAGQLGRQTLIWRLMGPNNPNRVLQETNDISHYNTQGQQVTQGSLIWEDGQLGIQTFRLTTKRYSGWEIEKRFAIMVYDIQGFPANVGSGQVNPDASNYTLTVQKHGHPNGIVRFDGVSQLTRQLDEPASGSTTLILPLVRREGVLGQIKVHWKLEGPHVNMNAPDTDPLSGIVTIQGGRKDGQIILNIRADNYPELDETFRAVLTKVEGGGEIDTVYNTSVFTIKYNDYPHGRFSIDSALQTVVVSSNDLKRRLRLNITRNDGVVGRVRVAFSMKYDQPEPGVSYLPSSGSVTFNSTQPHAVIHINLEPNVYLVAGATFTVTLTSVSYIGADMTDAPVIITDKNTAKVKIPKEAANSAVGFQTSMVTVNQATNLAKISITRLGSYGTVQVLWSAGYPSEQSVYGFSKGQVVPNSDTVTLQHGEDSKSFYIQVTPSTSSGPELFAVHLSAPPVTTAGGGARLRSTHSVCSIDPHGIVQFTIDSVDVTVRESQDEEMEVALTFERLYGSEGSIQVLYSTYSGTAVSGVDFVQVQSASVVMESAQNRADIYLQVKPDSISEVDEHFFVNITRIALVPFDTSQDISPRVSETHSTAKVTILRNSDPYGVVSITTVGANIVQEPGSVVLLIQRMKGSFGQIDVRVRTVGGNENWDSSFGSSSLSRVQGDDIIGQVLENRDLSTQAVAGQDYEILDVVISLQDGDTEKQVILYTLDDPSPESDECVYVYISAITEGVRVASPNTDDGRKGYVKVIIQRNDFWSGWMGFYMYNSSSVVADEDLSKPAILTVERRNATFGNVEIYWRAVLQKGSDAIKSSNIDLSHELLYTSNKAECLAGVRLCTFTVPLIQDSIPENTTSFLVELVRVSSGADIDPARKYANVTLTASDHPNGKVQFHTESRYVYVDRQTMSVSLKVERIGNQGKILTVSYRTVEYTEKQVIAGVDVYNAVSSSDFESKSGVLTFMPNQKTTTVKIALDILKFSSTPYPKAFEVKLTSISGNGELDTSPAVVTILDSGADMWRTWSQAQQSLNNASIDQLMNEVSRINRPLSRDEFKIVKDVLKNVLDVAESQNLLEGTRKSVMEVYCLLLSPAQKQATAGQWSLSQDLERFAFSFLSHQYACDNCCTPENKPIISPQCQYVSFHVAKWYPEAINGYTHTLTNQDYLKLPEDHLNVEEFGKSSDKAKCFKVVFVKYSSQQWFVREKTDEFLNQRIISVNIENEGSMLIKDPVKYRVHAPRSGIAVRKAHCVYFDENVQQWTDGNGICEVTNNLALTIDDFVDCSCKHMSHYAVRSDVRDPDKIGYPVWFHVSCFVCTAGLILVIVCHHLCSIYPMFAANLLMHMCFSVVGTEVCYVINAYLSPINILDILPESSNYRCIIIGVFTHYFFIAQFTWMLVQTVNFHKILVLNDEHTNRKYLTFFFLGWGLPAAIVFIFYMITYAIYRFVVNLPVDKIYADVHMNKDICFVGNVYAGLAGVIAPVLLCLLVVGVVFIQAFQISPQWQAYDDVYRGRQNIQEIKVLLLFWGCISLTWLWGGLHLAYGQVWMLILFCLFNIATGLFGFVAYAAVRNPCIPCCRSKSSIDHSVMGSESDDAVEIVPPPKREHAANLSKYMDVSLAGSKISDINDHKNSDIDGLGEAKLKVKRKPISSTTIPGVMPPSQPVVTNMYVHPSTPVPFINSSPTTLSQTKTSTSHPATDYTRDSTDFDDLIFALGTQSFIPSDTSQQDTEIKGVYDFQAVREAALGKHGHHNGAASARNQWRRVQRTRMNDTHL